MRKKYNLLLMLFIVCLLVACNTEDVNKADDGESPLVYFIGTIEDIANDNFATVSSEYGKVFVDLSVNKDVTFQVGDVIKVGYDGEWKESYPAQIRTKSVELVE